MRPDMVYQFPIWAVGLSLAILAVISTESVPSGRHTGERDLMIRAATDDEATAWRGSMMEAETMTALPV